MQQAARVVSARAVRLRAGDVCRGAAVDYAYHVRRDAGVGRDCRWVAAAVRCGDSGIWERTVSANKKFTISGALDNLSYAVYVLSDSMSPQMADNVLMVTVLVLAALWVAANVAYGGKR